MMCRSAATVRATRVVSVLAVTVMFAWISTTTDAQRRGGGVRAGASVNRNVSRTSVRSDATVNRNVTRNADIDRNVNRNIDVNRNVNVNRNVDIDRDIDFDRDIDVDVHYDRWGHPVARGVAAGVAAGVALGTTVAMLPSNCSTVVVNGIGYSQCGSTWYQPYYAGTTVQYVVVSAPR